MITYEPIFSLPANLTFEPIQRKTEVFCQDILEWCRTYEGEKYHALLCDPPYHLTSQQRLGRSSEEQECTLDEAKQKSSGPARFFKSQKGFMNQIWDGGDLAFQPATWAALGEHLHPGAFGLAFASARGWHRLACAIEDAGFIIHPTLFGWGFGSGMPKATRIDTQVDKKNGAERISSGISRHRNVKPYDDNNGWNANNTTGDFEYTLPATPLAQIWEGHRYGRQALTPALEPIICFQKPYNGKPLDNILETGAGAWNIEAGRIGEEKFFITSGRWPKNLILSHTPECRLMGSKKVQGTSQPIHRPEGFLRFDGSHYNNGQPYSTPSYTSPGYGDENGLEEVPAWECAEHCPVQKLAQQVGFLHGHGSTRHHGSKNGLFSWGTADRPESGGEEGTVDRYFYQADWSYEVAEQLAQANPLCYCAKVSPREKNAGLPEKSSHPTVKPLKLTTYLARLLLPPDAYAPRRILVPFAGTGSEMIGALFAGWNWITGIEISPEYVALAEARIKYWREHQP